MSTALKDNLEKYNAENVWEFGLDWMGDRTPAQVWLECERADWLLWWVAQNIGKTGWPTHQELVRVTVDCVRPVVDLHYPDKSHPCQIALETALAWTRGDATIDERMAAYAAYAATHAAYAAYSADAAHAAYAATHAAYAADAARAAHAADAATHAAYAAYAATHAAYAADAARAAYAADAARAAEQKRMCEVIRAAWLLPQALGEQVGEQK